MYRPNINIISSFVHTILTNCQPGRLRSSRNQSKIPRSHTYELGQNVECDFPRVFFELEVEIWTRDPHVYYKCAQNWAFLIFFFSWAIPIYVNSGFDFWRKCQKICIQKSQFWARLEYTCGSRVKISTSNSKKPRGKSHFSIWAQTLGAGRSGIYRKWGSQGPYSRGSSRAAGCHAVLFCVWCKYICKRLCVGSILIPPQEKTVSSPFSPYSKTCLLYTSPSPRD